MSRFAPIDSDPSFASRVTDFLGENRPLQMVLSTGLLAAGTPIFGLSFPASQLSLAVLVILGFFRKRERSLLALWWAVALLWAAWLFVTAVSAFSIPSGMASSWVNRSIRLVFIVLFVLQLASGQLHLVSILKGLWAGLLINAALFFAHLAPNYSPPYLTGFAGDKNAAGLYYSVIPILSLIVLRSPVARLVSVSLGAVLLWFTGSRTSLTGLGAGLLWTILIWQLPAVFRWISAFGIGTLVNLLEANFATAGVFESRTGSDALRGRIDDASLLKVQSAPWYGRGLGEASVNIENHQWYFHNSYWTLLVEGGWFYLVSVVGASVLIALRPFGRADRRLASKIVQGAMVVLLIDAWRLGEVLLTIPWALVFGAGLAIQLMPEADVTPVVEA